MNVTFGAGGLMGYLPVNTSACLPLCAGAGQKTVFDSSENLVFGKNSNKYGLKLNI